jgi:hypothetical protein
MTTSLLTSLSFTASAYTVDPDSDEDTGMVRDLVGPQRTYTDCWNKISETKNRRLNNQMIAPVGSQIQRRDDTPGAIIYYRPVGGQPPPSWEPTGDAGALLNALFEVLNQAKAEMQYIAGSDDLPPALASGPSDSGVHRAAAAAVGDVHRRPVGVRLPADAPTACG